MWSDNETSIDLLGCQHLVSVVTDIVRNDALLPTTIGVFGDWGSGKSSVLRMVAQELRQDEGVLVLEFNGWAFEGYDDAKTALIGTILEEVAKDEGRLSKAKGLLAKLFGRLDLMKIAFATGKHALAFGLGGPAALGLSLSADVTGNIKELLQKMTQVDENQLNNYLKENPTTALHRSVREFRQDFEELIVKTGLRAVVVIIDDLDRCLPNTIIETLEAIKLFLFAKRTVFLVGADERLVRYAVRSRFPELPGERAEVGRDYLEKLIQFAVRVPPLGRADIETFLGLLFAKDSLPPDAFEAARKQAIGCNKDNLLSVRFNAQVARELLQDKPVPPELNEGLLLAARVAPLLSIMSGYPRQCKRFFNMLLMRHRMADSRGIQLDRRVLAKLMLLEYYRPESFRKLAELQAAQGGHPKELRHAEEMLNGSPPGTAAKNGNQKGTVNEPGERFDKTSTPKSKSVPSTPPRSADLPPWLSDEWTKDWLRTEPALADLNLQTYFYFSRDLLGPLSDVAQRLSPRAQEVVARLLGMSEADRKNVLNAAGALSPADATAVFESLAEKARQEEDPGAVISALVTAIDWAKARPDLLGQLITFLNSFPEDQLAPQHVTRLESTAAKSDFEPAAYQLMERWSKSANEPLRRAAEARLNKRKR